MPQDIDYRLNLRDEIHFEHQLIGQRMGWYASFQAFLFTAFAISGASESRPIPIDLLPAIGLLSSGLAWLAILMAVIRLFAWHREEPPQHRFPILLQALALAYPIAMPLLFSWVWWRLWTL